MTLEPNNLPLEQQVPPSTLGLPPHIPIDPNAPFWRPSPGDLFRHLGWRNILFLPALGLLGIIIGGFFEPRSWLMIFQVGLKPAIIFAAIPIALCGYAIRAAVRARKDPFCIHCGQCLLGLPSIHICPECGRPYDLQLCEDYRRDPQWFIQRWRMRHELPSRDAQVEVPRSSTRRKSRDGT